jgi:hypothetical protein
VKSKFRLIMPICGLLVYSSAVSVALAEGDSMPAREEIEAALEECAASLQMDGDERPDHSAMDSCMSAKGFSRPSGPPPGRGGPGGRSPGA